MLKREKYDGLYEIKKLNRSPDHLLNKNNFDFFFKGNMNVNLYD